MRLAARPLRDKEAARVLDEAARALPPRPPSPGAQAALRATLEAARAEALGRLRDYLRERGVGATRDLLARHGLRSVADAGRLDLEATARLLVALRTR